MADGIVYDGKTGRAIQFNTAAPMDVYTVFILNLVSLIGCDAARAFLFHRSEPEPRDG